MPNEVLLFDCLCGKPLILDGAKATKCGGCKRTYWKYFDDKGAEFARLVWHPDERQLEKEYDTKIKAESK
jgi:hypothetical protein